MASMNCVSITGRLGADPEVKFLESGACVVKMRLAISEFYNGDEQTSWVTVEAWNRNAETAGNYLKKGSLVGITGALKEERWTRNDVQQSRLIVRAEQIHLLGNGNGNGKAQAEPKVQATSSVDMSDCPF